LSTGTLYSAPFQVSTSSTVRAIAMASGWTDSTLGSVVYTLTSIFLVAHAGALSATTPAINTTGSTLIVLACHSGSTSHRPQ
jgi:hypothetical protein